MARGPNGEKRPDDPASAAVAATRILVGDDSEILEDIRTIKDPSAVSLGRRGGLKGGAARAKALSPEERSDIAKRASAARWAKQK